MWRQFWRRWSHHHLIWPTVKLQISPKHKRRAEDRGARKDGNTWHTRLRMSCSLFWRRLNESAAPQEDLHSLNLMKASERAGPPSASATIHPSKRKGQRFLAIRRKSGHCCGNFMSLWLKKKIGLLFLQNKCAKYTLDLSAVFFFGAHECNCS